MHHRGVTSWRCVWQAYAALATAEGRQTLQGR